jgi:hypothetical protein
MSAGSGVFGELTRLRLGYQDRQPGDPESLVLKLPSRSPTNRARGRLFQLYERETRFYTELAAGVDLRVPRCYWAGSTRESDGSGLLLEDLDGMGTSDLYQGISAERARLAVQRLGVAHAQWWDCESRRDSRWIPRLNGRVMRQLGQVYRQNWPAFATLRGGTLPAEAMDLAAEVGIHFDELLEAISRPPLTIAHGDFRVDNLFFGEGGDDALVVIDWQLVCQGRGAYDVAYLLCQSMDIADRRRHETDVLRAWHDVLLECGVTGYSFDDAFHDYRLAVLVCFGCVVAGTSLDRPGYDRRALGEQQAQRTFTAALDLDARSLLAA